jgi:predicted RNA binding protein YcfA (HicA-like mRNA interferase family)
MSRITPIHYKALVKVFSKKGYSIARQEGSHIVMNKKDVARPIVIPIYDAVGIDIIKSCLRSAKIDRTEYFELLSDC